MSKLTEEQLEKKAHYEASLKHRLTHSGKGSGHFTAFKRAYIAGYKAALTDIEIEKIQQAATAKEEG